MSASNITTSLLNPNTPMAFVPAELEENMTRQTYAAIGSLAVLIWDILLHVAQDYRLAIQYGINFSFILYCLARVTCFAYILGVVIATTAPLGNCNLVYQLSILSFSIPLSVLPFLMRVSALYDRNRYVVTFFSVLWLFLLSCYIVASTETLGMPMGPTRYCSITRTRLADQLTTSSILAYDTLIFIATAWAFMRSSYSDVSVKNGIRVMVFGRYLPAFSRSILRDGQAYYLAALGVNILFCGLAFIPKPPISACAIAFPFYVMLNNLSSHVYRNLRRGFYQDQTIGSSAINRAVVQFVTSNHSVVNPTSTRLGPQDRDLELGDIAKPRGITTSLDQDAQGEEMKQRMVDV